MAKRTNRTRPPMRLRLVHLLLAAIIMGAVGALLADANHVPYGLFGGLIWVAVLAVTFFLGILYFAEFLVPIRGSEGWYEGLRLLLRHYVEGSPVPAPPKRRRQPGMDGDIRRDDPVPVSFNFLQAGLLKSHRVAAVARGGGFVRSAGPGFVTLYRGETIAELVDLRPHLRRQAVKANTRDGIPLETSVSVVFRIQSRPPAAGDATLPFPYEKDAIFHTSYASTVDEKDNMLPWTEQVCPQAASWLVTELGQYTLNELYDVEEGDELPLPAVQQSVQGHLERLFAPQGVEIVSVSVGRISVLSDIRDQRIRTWQSIWERQIQLQYAAGDAEAMRRTTRARARAQIEIIESIVQSIESMRLVGKDNLTEIITLRMIEVLEQTLASGSASKVFPEQLLADLVHDTSSQMRAALTSGSEDV